LPDDFTFKPPIVNPYVENPLGKLKRWWMNAARIVAVVITVACGAFLFAFSLNNILMFILVTWLMAFMGVYAYILWVYIRIRFGADDEAKEIRKNKEVEDDI